MAVRKTTQSNRQKMINLMYILLMAMLAINESSQIFNGYKRRPPMLSDEDMKVTAKAINDTSAVHSDNVVHDTLSVIRHDTISVSSLPDKDKPSATVASDIMNILYAGYENPLSVSSLGISAGSVYVTATNAKVRKDRNEKYLIKPDSIGVDVHVSVAVHGSGKRITEQVFKVRELPEPTPYLIIDDGRRFHGGSIERQKLINAEGINVALDNGMLDIPFMVLSFEAILFDSMGNAMRMPSDGSSFSERQKMAFKTVSRNKRIHITKVTVISPDGMEMVITNPLEIIVK